MKKKLLLLLALLTLLTGCKNEENLKQENQNKDKYETIATILEIKDDSILVVENNKENDKFIINNINSFNKEIRDTLKKGTTISFTHTGDVAFSDPPRIHATSIEIID